MRILSKFIIISLLLVSQSWAQGTTTTIAAFGDSLFAGYGIAAPEALPAKLEQKLLAEGYNVKIINHGVSGDTTAGGINRVDFVLADKPDIIILELGANDLLRAFPPSMTQTNLETIIQKLQASGAKILLVGIVAPLNYGQKFADEYNGIFPSLAAKYSLPLYPEIMKGVWGRADLLQQDRVHPLPAGVDIMVTGMLEYIKPLLKK